MWMSVSLVVLLALAILPFYLKTVRAIRQEEKEDGRVRAERFRQNMSVGRTNGA